MSDHQLTDSTSSSPNRESSIDYHATVSLTAEQAPHAERIFLDWERGPFVHLTRLFIPDSGRSREFRFDASGILVDGLLSARVYCDSLTGLSGSDLENDPIVADVVTSGWIEFQSKKEKHVVKPGQICIRDTKASWAFTCAPATVAHVVSIPRNLVIPHIGSPRVFDRAYVCDVDVPEVRFFLSFLEGIKRSSGELEDSIAAQSMAREACATLLSGIVAGRSGPWLNGPSNAMVVAAKNFIDRNIESSELTPQVVAQSVGVSLRTLHRYFAVSDDSVMAFTRRRRLQRAHEELTNPGSRVGISEIAARWHFADTSHFIRQFKSLYGDTPAAYLRNQARGRRS
ncbi:helix-turn-helix domain-containing protein [Actinacidiphila glaucinigra]|uniref:helix-turn-helix domain-containing protein n=1 Tax=Actinacidiphila glaucinigra TaxID=235986 RepID=UPI0035DA28F3